MNSTSVGFRPDYKHLVFGDTEKGEPSVTYTKNTELLELSLVSVGCNPDALLTSKSITKAISDKVITKAEIEELQKGIETEDEVITHITKEVSDDKKTITELEDKVKELELKLYTQVEEDVFSKIYDEYVGTPKQQEEKMIDDLLTELK